MDSLFKIGVMVQALDMVSGPFRKMGQSVQGLQRIFERAKLAIDLGGKLTATGALMQGAADKMKRYLIGILDPMFKLQDAMAPLSTVIDSTMGGAIQSMVASREAAIDWSKIHVQSADEFIRSQYLMASAGLNDIQSIEGTRSALTLATATMGDNSDAAKLLAVIYNTMGDQTNDVAQEMTKLSDVLVASQQYFQYADLNQMTESLKTGVPAALTARMGIEELNVVLGQLNTSGLQGSMAGTAFSASMRQMNKASADLGFSIARTADGGVDYIGTLQNITGQYGDLSKASGDVQQKFQQAFGDQGLRAIVLLQNKTGDMSRALDAVSNSSGVASAAQARMESTFNAQWTIAMNNMNALRIEIGNMLLPLINEGLPKIREFVGRFADIAKANPEITKTIVVIAGIGVALISILAPIMLVAGGLLALFGWVSAGIAKFWGVGLLVVKFFTGPFFKGLVMLSGGLRTVTMFVWAFSASLLANPITWIILGIVALIAIIVLLVRNWDKVTLAFGVGWEWIKDIWGNGVAWLENLWDDIFIFIKGLAPEFMQSGIGLIEAFTKGIISVISNPADAVKKGLSKLRNLLPFSDAKEGPLSTLTYSGRALIETFGAGALSRVGYLKKAVSGILSAASMTAPLQMDMAVSGVGLSLSSGKPIPNLREVFRSEIREREVNSAKGKRGEVHLHYHGGAKKEKDDFFDEAQRRIDQNS